MDLKKMLGDRYVIRMDESWDAEKPENRAEFEANNEKKWYYQIQGRYGMIYPYSESILGARVSRRIGKKALALLGSELQIFEDSIEAISFRTDLRNIKTILKLIKPERRHQISDQTRESMVARMDAINARKPKITQEKSTSGTLPGPIITSVTL